MLKTLPKLHLCPWINPVLLLAHRLIKVLSWVVSLAYLPTLLCFLLTGSPGLYWPQCSSFPSDMLLCSSSQPSSALPFPSHCQGLRGSLRMLPLSLPTLLCVHTLLPHSDVDSLQGKIKLECTQNSSRKPWGGCLVKDQHAVAQPDYFLPLLCSNHDFSGWVPGKVIDLPLEVVWKGGKKTVNFLSVRITVTFEETLGSWGHRSSRDTGLPQAPLLVCSVSGEAGRIEWLFLSPCLLKFFFLSARYHFVCLSEMCVHCQISVPITPCQQTCMGCDFLFLLVVLLDCKLWEQGSCPVCALGLPQFSDRAWHQQLLLECDECATPWQQEQLLSKASGHSFRPALTFLLCTRSTLFSYFTFL